MTHRELDDIDLRLLDHLSEHGRSTWRELGELVGLSAPAVAERVRRLEADGCILGYEARVSPEAVGLPIVALVFLAAEAPSYHDDILRWAREAPGVQECHVVAGDFDYVFKIHARNTRELDDYLRTKVRAIPGVSRSRTTIVLTTVKDSRRLPLLPSD
ncbi:MAG: Lrp/AsnC family transcriptional regulator [Gemmatimonadota bacterium]|nr:Lrp/AsnC family transcriptional regulator [Gemmatimonadota bacterium]